MNKSLIKNSLANGFGVLGNTLMQLLSVPLLIGLWGVNDYGIWVMLATIPVYLGMSDFGYIQASTSAMTMRNGRGKYNDVKSLFQTLWWMGVAVNIAIGMVLISALQSLPIDKFEWMGKNKQLIVLVVIYSLLVVQSRIPLAGLRSVGKYSSSTIGYDFLVFVELSCALVIAMYGGGILEYVYMLIIGRILILFVMCWVLVKSKSE